MTVGTIKKRPTAALKAAHVPYDRWRYKGFALAHPAEVWLVPVVLWFTGYDWFDPVHASETDRLVAYPTTVVGCS
jgi:hypothetical protein